MLKLTDGILLYHGSFIEVPKIDLSKCKQGKEGIPFDTAFFQFASSHAYKMLFKYSTGMWMEGQDYLRGIFDENKSRITD